MPNQFFINHNDLMGWIKSKPSEEQATNELMEVIKTFNPNSQDNTHDNDIKETCKQIYTGTESEQETAAKALFGVLAKHNITTIKEASNKNMTKKAVSESRFERNKWNKTVDGFNEGTPWRNDRNKFYNFTHYYTDAITFDEDPKRVYSGEALWRMYIMDKYTREYQNKEGRWVGGYINDRFYVFPDAGTPANQEVDRMGGNQMELAQGERTRKPRPHQWSTERRLEEARGNKLKDLEATTASSFKKVIKTASSLPKDRTQDKIYNIFTDILDMRESNVNYEKRIELLSEHYDSSPQNIAQIEKVAEKMIKKHNGIAYSFNKYAEKTNISQPTSVEVVKDDKNIVGVGTVIVLKPGTQVFVQNPNVAEVLNGSFQGLLVRFNKDVEQEVGLIEEQPVI